MNVTGRQLSSCRIKSQAVELLQLYDRAGEETARILNDIRAAIDHFCAFHTGLIKDAENASAGVRALLLRKAKTTESVMADIWHVAGKHLQNLCSMPHVLNEFHSNNHESSAELECETPWTFLTVTLAMMKMMIS